MMPDAIRLPLPIDPRNPERGLWGMVDWGRFDYVKGESNKFKLIKRLDKAPWWKDLYIGHNIELALLKALAFQWGVEVKDEKNNL